jgi:hypothetical protein
MANDVTFDGGANFIGNWVGNAGVPRQDAVNGSGGAVYVEGDSMLTLGGPAVFRYNSAATGGAVTLGSDKLFGVVAIPRPRMVFATSNSSSCWIGNYAVKSAGGAALRIEAQGRVEFGTLAQHNFGSNVVEPLVSRTQYDITVQEKGSYMCGDKVRGAGRYKIEGDVCSTRCSVQQICKCPDSQHFADSVCGCQARV